MLGRLSRDQQVVVACVRRALLGMNVEPDWESPPDEASWDSVVELARRYMVGPVVYAGAKSLEVSVPSHALAVLRTSAIQVATRDRVWTETTLRKALDPLALAGLKPVVLKGAALAYNTYPQPTYRTLSDVDLLLPRCDLQRASQILQDNGFLVADDESQNLAREHHHLPAHYLTGSGITVELHDHLVANPNPYEIRVDELFDRAIPAPVGGVQTRVLAPVDALHHACVHLGYSHQYQFLSMRNLVDILALTTLGRAPLDWDFFSNTVRRSRTAGTVYWPLRMAREWLAAPIPDAVLHGLAPFAPVRQILEKFAEPALILDGDEPTRKETAVLYSVLRDFSTYGGCSILVQAEALRNSIFPSPERVGHLPSSFTHHRVHYASYLVSPRRISRGMRAFGRLVAGR